MADESKESTGDPLRDAIISSSRAASEARELQAAETNDPALTSDWSPPPEEEFRKEWTTPYSALRMMRPVYGDHSERWIMGRLKSGYIFAVARQCEWRGNLTSYVPVPRGCWEAMSDLGDAYFWDTGDASFTYNGSRARLFDVRFQTLFSDEDQGRHPTTLEAPMQPQEAQPQPNKGGRPRNEYWEPLLIEIARQLYLGDLQPARQTDIENAMHDWLVANGHKGGETQVRQRAKSLWEAIQK